VTRVEYSKRALADLDEIATYYSGHAGPHIALAIEARIREVVARIGSAPESARQVEGRPNVRVVPVIRYPFKIFYWSLCAA
jgi:plasmid stabilization system protein ParE